MPGLAQFKTQARLILSSEEVKAGGTVMAGVELKMADKWHTYWKNPGESGSATKIEWILPSGITAGDILWPTPERIEAADITTFGYNNTVVLMVPLKLDKTLNGQVDLRAKVSWLECADLCVPGKAEVSAKLLVGDQNKASQEAPLIFDWSSKVPTPVGPELGIAAVWADPGQGDNRTLAISLNLKTQPKSADFFPYSYDKFELKGKTESAYAAGKLTLRKVVNKFEGGWPRQVAGVLVLETDGPGESRISHEVTLNIAGSETDLSQPPQANTQQSPPGNSTVAKSANLTQPVQSAGLLTMLGFAFLGGLILNIMPCVLPVIALKILGFVHQSKEAPGKVRVMGLVYGLGVLASFLALAVMVIIAQRASGTASWGMQMQNPPFRVVMTAVVVLVALNLFGVFEVTLAGSAMGAAGTLASKDGMAGAFFNGVLATALATPCTAPFLAAALGYAFTQSAGIIVLMFSVIALGLAFPYVLLSFQPAWLKFLPKPGLWMQQFKVAMGFPMLATGIWLFDLSSDSFGESGALWIGLFLVSLAFSAWVWGEFVQKHSKRKTLAAAASVIIIVSAYFVALEKELNWRHPTAKAASGILKHSPDGIEWTAWSAPSVQQARDAGKVVMVDFTAKWCLTCKANKRTSIEIPEVKRKLTEIGASAFIADNTDPNPAINDELKKYGRAGVPLVLVFPKDKSKEPLVLPALLTPGIVLDALAEAAK